MAAVLLWLALCEVPQVAAVPSLFKAAMAEMVEKTSTTPVS